ncbi:MAG: glycine zipper 2TM domain-containing protein [Rugosibacter sp.]|nr:glycine zipper 2TM domain-containing protein [Rugosibacter sp.]
MQTHPKLLYPSMVIAAITVTIFSLLGIATMTGILPLAHSLSNPASDPLLYAAASTSAVPGTAVGQDVTSASGVSASSASREPVTVPACRLCGRVEAVDMVEAKGKGSGVGAVAGGIAGALIGNSFGRGNGRTALTLLGAGGGAYAGNEIEKNVHKTSSYRIRVRLENGTERTLYQRAAPGVTAGDRIRIVDGGIVRQS